MNKKKILSLMLAGCMLTSMIPAALATEPPQDTTPPVVIESVEGEVNSNTEPGTTNTEAGTTTETTPTPGETESPVAPAPDVAQITTNGETVTKYKTLQLAIDAAVGDQSPGTEIVLTADTTECITIPADKTLTLEIQAGVTLTNATTVSEGTYSDTISNKGTLTIKGTGTVDNVTHGRGALVNYPGGSVTLEDGITLTRSKEVKGNSWYVIKNLGTLTINNANVNVSTEQGGSSSLINNGWYDSGKLVDNDRKTSHSQDATAILKIGSSTSSGGTFSGGMNTVKNDDFGVLTIVDGTFSNNSGPNVLNWNETTINGGSFEGSSTATAMIANGFWGETGGAGKLTITDGIFIARDNGAGPLIGYGGESKGGKFSIEGGTFTGALPAIPNNLTFPFEISGGTFSADPSNFVVADYVGVKNAAGNYEVMHYADVTDFAPTMDVTQAGGVTATKTDAGFALSGTVDPRTYTVTDANLQTLFVTLLTDKQPDTNTSRTVAPVSGKIMYIANNKNLSFATMHFENLVADQSYIIQQVNPALGYAYNLTAFPDNTKIKSYTGKELEDGLSFIISGQTGDFSFAIAPAPVANAATGDAPVTMPENPAVYTITNGVTFTASEKPGTTTVEPPVKVEASGDTVTAKADVAADTIKEAVTAATNTGTVTIKATTPVENVNAAEVTLPKAAVDELATSTDAKVENVEIQTSVGTVKLPGEVLKTIAGDSNISSGATVTVKDVTTTAADAPKTFEVVVKTSGAVKIENLVKPITLSFNVGANRTDSPVLMHVDNSVLKPIVSSTYDATTGILTAETSHLSTFAVFAATDVEKGGIGCKVTLTSTAASKYLTIQVTHGNANSIYTVQADSSSKAVIYVQSGTVLNVWQTDDAPTFDNGSVKPKGTPTILVDNKTVTAP